MRESKIILGLGSTLLAGLLFPSCSGGGSGNGATSLPEFELTSISVPSGATWQINRAMEFVFSVPVDFASVGPNTINIQTATGIPANGVFSMKSILIDADGNGIPETPSTDPKVVVFQPACPTRDDLSDAGLMVGSVQYVITVIGRSSNAQDTVRSKDGIRLETTQTRTFRTPVSADSTTAFLDPVAGPPQPIIREVGSTKIDGVSYFELGGNPNNRVFFELDPATQLFSLSEPAFQAPLNLYSDSSSRIAAVIVFNQPVSPNDSNINQDFLRLEFQDGNGVWKAFKTKVELVENCTTEGAVVRLEPVGILPVASMVRAVINPGFKDLTGQEDIPIALSDFAVAPTVRIDFMTLSPADVEGDEIFEGFTFGGQIPGSNEDVAAIFDTPPAQWGGGVLEAGFTFNGTGGPGGNFDWVIPAGTIAFLDTDSDEIVGGENGAPEAIQTIVGGVVDVRNLIIEPGATLRVQGTLPLCVNASGEVIIRGTLNLSGNNATNVASLNTGNQPESGAPGAAGGGRGGDGSWITNNSTPFGMTGFGPRGEAGAGGFGGETGYNPVGMGNQNNRRPGGGGGGRFAADLEDSVYGPGPTAIVRPSTAKPAIDPNDPNDPSIEDFGLLARAGFNGNSNAIGAVTGQSPPLGGPPGLGPFLDGDEDNDFWGIRPTIDESTGAQIFIRGELTSINAGYGGGAGGDASFASEFPTPNWSIASDEKGGGGGGGGGGLHIKALGRIIIGQQGQILAQGGRGATGENTNFVDHVGGGGGGGSGGHVVLETATLIDFTDGQPNLDWGTNPFLQNEDNGFLPFQGGRPRILANGGDGATIGDNGDGNGDTVPPTLGYAGDGGPGVIQIHVPNPRTRPSTGLTPSDIIVPLQTAVLSDVDVQDVLRSIMAPGGIPMVPSFGARSRARSDWITLGAADQAEDGSEKQVLFYFDGTDPTDGQVRATDGRVDELDPLLTGLITGNSEVSVNAAGDVIELSGSTLDDLVMDASPLSDDIYLRTPALLQSFLLRLTVDGDPGVMRSFNVVAASYDDATTSLSITVDVGNLGNTLQQFITTNSGGPIRYTLIPRFFRILTNDVENILDEDATVRITFQAVGADPFGDPDEEDILVDFTGDITDLNAQPAGAIQFVRFEVEFDLATGGGELTVDTAPVAIDFLRIPFRF